MSAPRPVLMPENELVNFIKQEFIKDKKDKYGDVDYKIKLSVPQKEKLNKLINSLEVAGQDPKAIHKAFMEIYTIDLYVPERQKSFIGKTIKGDLLKGVENAVEKFTEVHKRTLFSGNIKDTAKEGHVEAELMSSVANEKIDPNEAKSLAEKLFQYAIDSRIKGNETEFVNSMKTVARMSAPLSSHWFVLLKENKGSDEIQKLSITSREFLDDRMSEKSIKKLYEAIRPEKLNQVHADEKKTPESPKRKGASFFAMADAIVPKAEQEKAPVENFSKKISR